MRLKLVPLLAVLACQSLPSPRPEAATVPADEQVPLGRLDRRVVPTAYALALEIDPSTEAFSGRVQIAVRVAAPTAAFFLHGRGLAVSEARLVGKTGVIPARYVQVHEEGVARVVLERPAAAGEWTLELAWSAPFDHQLVGLYKVTEGGASYAFTQFEPLSARRAFPCFDEPSFKVPFELALTVPAAERAVANTSELSAVPARAGFVTHRFARTPPLPTYLVAFAAGPLEIVDAAPVPASPVRARPLPLRGVAVRGKGGRLQYALERAGGILTTLEGWFGLPYPYDKLDLVAVPDFAAGAMENAGLVTFREYLLLLGDDAGADQKRAFASVTAHELAHQWFGDLVTMAWWDDLWLNEAFATWMATRTIRAWDPAAKADLEALDDTHRAMDVDSRAAARAVRQPIASAHDIHNAFDAITYTKGAAVLRMFESWMGEDTFRAGVTAYLQRHAHGNATTDDFLAALSGAAGLDVAAPMKTFLDQPGVPLLRVETDEARRTIRAARFLPLGSAASAAGEWLVPVRLPGSAPSLLPPAGLPLTEPGVAPRNEGYFRQVLESSGEARRFRHSEPLEPLPAGTSEAALLTLADAIDAGLAAGTLAMDAGLARSAAFAAHPERLVARAPMERLRFARDRLVSVDHRPALEAWSRRLYARQALGRFDARPADDAERLFQRDLLEFLLHVGRDPKLRAEAQALGTRWARGEPVAFDATLLGLALGVAVEDGGAPVFDALLQRLEKTDDSALRRRMVAALGRSAGPLGERARALFLGPALRSEELWSLLGAQLSRPENAEPAWRWLQANVAAIRRRLPEEAQGSLPWLAGGFCDATKVPEIEAFFAPVIASLPGGPRELATVVEEVRLCAAQVAFHREAADRFFAAAP
jgi:alanyl aminopeptidase